MSALRLKAAPRSSIFPQFRPLLALLPSLFAPFWPSPSPLLRPREAIKWATTRHEKFYNQAPDKLVLRCIVCIVASRRRTPETRGVGRQTWMAESYSLRRTRLGYNKSRDINIWKQSVRGLHSEWLRFCVSQYSFLPTFLSFISSMSIRPLLRALPFRLLFFSSALVATAVPVEQLQFLFLLRRKGRRSFEGVRLICTWDSAIFRRNLRDSRLQWSLDIVGSWLIANALAIRTHFEVNSCAADSVYFCQRCEYQCIRIKLSCDK